MFELRAKSNKETDVMMYGSISEWGRVRAEDFIRAIASAKAQGYEKVNLKIHSPGGSIFEGLAIISQMNDGIEVHAYVEGMAASMASALVACSTKAYMVKGTRMMIHQGAGGVMGSSNQIRNYADLLDSLNKTLADIYAKKTGKDAKWILDNWMAEGKDTWFTAEQALKEKLIDGIVEGKVQPMPKEESATVLEMAAHYDQYLKTENTMDKKELIALLGLKADATDAEITAAIAANKTEAAKATATKAAADAAAAGGKKAEDEAAEKTLVIEAVATLAKERGMDDKQIASLKVLAGVDMKAAMGLIPAKAADTTEASKEKPLNVAELIATIKGSGKDGMVNKNDQNTWDFNEWSKHPKEFAALLEKDPAAYQKVFKAEFGYEPSLDELKGLVFKK